MKMYWGVVVQLHTFLTLAPDGGEWSASCLSCFTPGTKWVGPTASLDTLAKIKLLITDCPCWELTPLIQPVP